MKSLPLHRWLPLVVFLVVALAAVAVVLQAVNEVQTTRTSAGFSRQFNDDNLSVYVTLTVTSFDTVTDYASGTAHVEIYPKNDQAPASAMPTGTLMLDLLHFPVPDAENNQGYLIEGGTVKAMDLADLDHIPDTAFSWHGSAQVSSFLYPFDAYVLHLNPQLAQSTDTPGVTRSLVVDTTTVNLETASMRMRLTPLDTTDMKDDPAVVLLERPVAIRAVAVIIAVLAVIWLITLIFLADTKDFTGGIITFFVGVWGLRATLMGGVSIFPTLIDYVVLAFSVVAVGVMLAHWTAARVKPPGRQ